MIVSQPVPSRYHALDSLRASMMFLRIVLHAMVAYAFLGALLNGRRYPVAIRPVAVAAT